MKYLFLFVLAVCFFSCGLRVPSVPTIEQPKPIESQPNPAISRPGDDPAKESSTIEELKIQKAAADRQAAEWSARAKSLESQINDEREAAKLVAKQQREAWLGYIAMWTFAVSVLGIGVSLFLFFWLGSMFGKLALSGVLTFGVMAGLSIVFITLQRSLAWIGVVGVVVILIIGIVILIRNLLKTTNAVKLVGSLAERLGDTTDYTEMFKAKLENALDQERIGVSDLIAKVRGKKKKSKKEIEELLNKINS